MLVLQLQLDKGDVCLFLVSLWPLWLFAACSQRSSSLVTEGTSQVPWLVLHTCFVLHSFSCLVMPCCFSWTTFKRAKAFLS